MKHKHLKNKFNDSCKIALINSLLPYIGEPRLQRLDSVIQHRLSSIHLAIESPSNIHNALAAIRTAEAFGIQHIHLINPEEEVNAARIITQGAVYWVDIHYHDNLNDFRDYIGLPKNISLAGGTLRATMPLSDVSIDTPLCIMIGNEQAGLTQAAHELCDQLYTIPMVGMSQSLNLSVSAAISLYDVTSRKRNQLQQSSDLSVEESTTLRAQYMLNSVDTRLAENLVEQACTHMNDK